MTVAEAVLVGLVLALAQSLHCMGMCGVFALRAARGGLAPGMAGYLSGKTFTYVFLGALAGAAGATALVYARPLGVALGVLAGAALVVSGLRRAADRPARALASVPVLGAALAGVGGGVAETTGAFGLGALTGFIPCGAVGLALLQGMTSGGPLQGAAVMAGFGAGTAPALVAVALAGRLGLARGSPWPRRLSAVILVAFGLLTLWRSVMAATHPDVSPCCL